ncbi:MAG: aldo/keto reductase, partial [Firmicutes bacterium]|nr:aldo/keto reductase [Bacillota bacterium]
AVEILKKDPLTSELAENLVICSKSLTHDYNEMLMAVEEACRDMNRSHIDIFLLHEVRAGQFLHRQGAWQALIDARSKGLVKAIGLSTHDQSVAAMCADIPELDVVFPLINYAGLGIRNGNEAGSAEGMMAAIKKCRDSGKGVFSMKALGGGNLTIHYQKALDYVFGQEVIDSVMIGFGSIGDVDDLLSYMDGTMTPDYNPDTSSKIIRVNHEDCIGCGCCKSSCASDALHYGKDGLMEVDNSKCITCGYCAYACPYRAIIMY